jgi:hypothetical protein
MHTAGKINIRGCVDACKEGPSELVCQQYCY